MGGSTVYVASENMTSWDTMSAWSMGCGAARTSSLQVLVLTFILIISSTVAGPIIAQLTCSHKLVGYMLLGFVCTDRLLDMIVTAQALEDLKWVMVICKAFTAFETATQLASASELKYYGRCVSFAAVSHVVACFSGGLLVLLALLSSQGFSSMPDCNFQAIGTCVPLLLHATSYRPASLSLPAGAPVPSGGFAVATAAAIGVVATAAEPSMYVDIVTEARAQGLFVAAGLRVASGTALISTLLLLLTAPAIGFGHQGAGRAFTSTIVSILLSFLVTLLLWQAIVTATRVPFKHWLGSLSPKLGRHYSDATDRSVKMVLVLSFAATLFWFAEHLESLTTADLLLVVHRLVRYTSCVHRSQLQSHTDHSPHASRQNGTGVSKLMYAPAPAVSGPPFALTFQPWVCCFFASFLVCNKDNSQQTLKRDWHLMLQPFKPYVLHALGTLSGLWLTSSTIFGGPGLIALALFFVRLPLVWLLGLANGGFSLPPDSRLQKLRGAGLDRVLQGPVALCLLWELQARCPALGAEPHVFAAVAGALIFLELLVGAPLLRFALWLAGEQHVDKMGHACVLGAEGAPPVITLKLLEWEVRAGAHGNKCCKIEWKVRDFDVTDRVDESSVRQILLKAKPDAFVSMMQDDQLNYDACELLQSKFDIPRCVVQCLDSAWSERFRALGTLGAGSGDVCIASSTAGSMSNFLDRFVASPQSAIMLLHDDPSADVIKVTITSNEAGTYIKDMKLPDDIQVLTIQRGKIPIVPHGHTKLQNDDEVIICGRPKSLSLVTATKKGKVVLVLGH